MKSSRVEGQPCKERGRGWTDSAVSQGMPRIASHPQKAEERRGIAFSSGPPKGISPTNTWTPGF